MQSANEYENETIVGAVSLVHVFQHADVIKPIVWLNV